MNTQNIFNIMKLAKTFYPVTHFVKGKINSRNYEEEGDWNTTIISLRKVTKWFQRLLEPQWNSLTLNGKTWHSSELYLKWPTFQNFSNSTAMTHLGSYKRLKDIIKGTKCLSCINKGQCSWLYYSKDTGQKCNPWKSGKAKPRANIEEH